MGNKKPENMGGFSEKLLKKKFGKNYKTLTQKDYKDLTKQQKKIWDSAVKANKEDRGNRALSVNARVNQPSSLTGTKPDSKFGDVHEIHARSFRMSRSNEIDILNQPMSKKQVDEMRRINYNELYDDIGPEGHGGAKKGKGKVSAQLVDPWNTADNIPGAKPNPIRYEEVSHGDGGPTMTKKEYYKGMDDWKNEIQKEKNTGPYGQQKPIRKIKKTSKKFGGYVNTPTGTSDLMGSPIKVQIGDEGGDVTLTNPTTSAYYKGMVEID